MMSRSSSTFAVAPVLKGFPTEQVILLNLTVISSKHFKGESDFMPERYLMEKSESLMNERKYAVKPA